MVVIIVSHPVVDEWSPQWIGMVHARQSLIDIRDVADACMEILNNDKHKNKVYQLTGSESLTYTDVAERFSEILQRPIRYRTITNSHTKQEMLAGGVPSWNANALAEIQETFASGAFSSMTDDLNGILGREPRKFSEFIEDYKVEFS